MARGFFRRVGALSFISVSWGSANPFFRESGEDSRGAALLYCGATHKKNI